MRIKLLILLFVLITAACQAETDSLPASTGRLKAHMKQLTGFHNYRNFQHPETLDSVADYILAVYNSHCDTAWFQEYEVNGDTFRNVIGSLGPRDGKRIVVGAHYDVAYNTPGADDNASGVCGLLELARLLKDQRLNVRIDLVAYTLEEPPFFGTKNMGSFVHARSLYENGVQLMGMIGLDMIGYFDDSKNSQKYPMGMMKLIHGSRGDFIMLALGRRSGRFGRVLRRSMEQQDLVKTVAVKGLKALDLSDHMNYRNFGYTAAMITDTAHYRNPNYHSPDDTIDTIDFASLAAVISELYVSLLKLQKV